MEQEDWPARRRRHRSPPAAPRATFATRDVQPHAPPAYENVQQQPLSGQKAAEEIRTRSSFAAPAGLPAYTDIGRTSLLAELTVCRKEVQARKGTVEEIETTLINTPLTPDSTSQYTILMDRQRQARTALLDAQDQYDQALQALGAHDKGEDTPPVIYAPAPRTQPPVQEAPAPPV